jgi:hypothetical protein
MYLEFDLPDLSANVELFGSYWLHTIFVQSPSQRYEINALVSTYVRLVASAIDQYGDGAKRLREFWSEHTSINLGSMNRSISHFEACIFSMNRATNCLRRLRGDKQGDPVAIFLRKDKIVFAQDGVYDRIRMMRNEILHLEESVLNGKVLEGQSFALRPDGSEIPHPSEANQTIKTIDRLVIGSHEIKFRDLVIWLTEMMHVVARIVEALAEIRYSQAK